MDPFSLTVGILTIVGAGSTIGKGLKKIISARRQPDILLQLNNEVVDLQYVVQDVQHLLRQQAQTAGEDQGPLSSNASLTSALEHAKETLLALESLVAYELTTVDSRNGRTKLDWVRWLRVEPQVKSLKDDIRTDRVRLSSALSLLASFVSLGVHDQMRRIYFRIETVKFQVAQPGEAPRDQDGGQTPELRGSEQAVTDQFFQNENQISEPSETDTDLETFAMSSRLCQSQSPQSEALVRPYAATFDLTRSMCEPDCSCACHKGGRIRSPRHLNAIFGSLSIGYSAQPWMTRTCDSSGCRGRSSCITYRYAFPRWLLDRMISFRISYEQSRGPELCLRLSRVRSRHASIFKAAEYMPHHQEVAIQHMKHLLTSGEASVLDVDPHGYTALQVAVMERNYDTAAFLITAGSDIFYENSWGCSAYTLAFQKSSSLNHFDNQFSALFGHRPNLTLLRLPTLIRTYLCSSRKSFNSVLSMIPRSAVDDVDANGDTTLSWAVKRRDSDSIRQLLLCGSDPEHVDLYGSSPLNLAVWSGDVAVVQLLLAAKVNVNVKNILGGTALSMAAVCTEKTTIMELLLDHGANIENQDNDGQRPLHAAVYSNTPAKVQFLLDRGANINGAAGSGWTALLGGVCNNAHGSLSVLLRNEALEIDGKDSEGFSMLDYAACYGDLETLHLLQSSRHIKRIDLDGGMALDHAEQRRDNNEDWSLWAIKPPDKDPQLWCSAFEALWNSIVEAQQRDLEGNPVAHEWAVEEEPRDDDEDSVVWEEAQEDPGGSIA